jgi:hypothetical protein
MNGPTAFCAQASPNLDRAPDNTIRAPSLVYALLTWLDIIGCEAWQRFENTKTHYPPETLWATYPSSNSGYSDAPLLRAQVGPKVQKCDMEWRHGIAQDLQYRQT